jgi:hypothetical protein
LVNLVVPLEADGFLEQLVEEQKLRADGSIVDFIVSAAGKPLSL